MHTFAELSPTASCCALPLLEQTSVCMHCAACSCVCAVLCAVSDCVLHHRLHSHTSTHSCPPPLPQHALSSQPAA